MKRLLCLLCLLTGFFGTGRAQEENFGVLVGETEIEALDISQVERLEHLLAHPLRINELSRSRLLSSGLFSRYQVATLLDWRENEGDILSAGELALVDGFGRRQAELLAPFLSFVSDRLPGQSRRKPELQAEMTLRGAWRGGEGSGGGRLTLFREDRWAGALRAMGNALGRFLYVADAVTDLKHDAVFGNYNPFRRYYGLPDNDARFHDLLKMHLGECLYYFDKLPIVQDAGLLQNILCLGLWSGLEKKQKKSHAQETANVNHEDRDESNGIKSV